MRNLKSMSDHTVLLMDEVTSSSSSSSSSSSVCICRICHEHEQDFLGLEAPCACSGTLKFAHRGCVQRWCNEKGNTTCEICLQNFEPGYTVPPKESSHFIHSTATIRESRVVPPNGLETENSGQNTETDYTGCISADNDSAASCCRSVALIFTCLLVMRHMFDVLAGGTQGYPFSLVTVVIVKATGIIVPMYVLVRIIPLICNSIKHHQYQNFDMASPSSNSEDIDEDSVPLRGYNNA